MSLTDTTKKVLMVAAALSAFALGGSAIAAAASGGESTDTRSDSAAADSQGDGDVEGDSGQRSDETPLTGDTATKVKEAALAKTGGGTVDRVETDAEGNAAYEAHITKSDGTRVTVYVDEQFNVVGVDEHAGHPDSGGAPQDGDA